MAVKLPNSALGGEIGIGRLWWRCGGVWRAMREEFMMSLCKGWRQMRVVAPPTWSCTQRKGGRRCPFSPASYNIAIVALLGGVCSSKQLRVASRFWADATNHTLSHESLRARCQRLVPTRCYGSGAPPALPQPASLARGRLAGNSRESSGLSMVLPDAHQPHPNVKWTTLCTYTNSWVRPKRRRGRGGGG